MMDSSAERKKEAGAQPQFLLSGFTQAAGIRIYAFEGRVDARRMAGAQADVSVSPRPSSQLLASANLITALAEMLFQVLRIQAGREMP
jgi:hypothetical protein